jgi:hypothetical protein
MTSSVVRRPGRTSTRQKVRSRLAASRCVRDATADGLGPRPSSALSKVRQYEGLLDAAPDPECRRADDDLLVSLAGDAWPADLLLTSPSLRLDSRCSSCHHQWREN